MLSRAVLITRKLPFLNLVIGWRDWPKRAVGALARVNIDAPVRRLPEGVRALLNSGAAAKYFFVSPRFFVEKEIVSVKTGKTLLGTSCFGG